MISDVISSSSEISEVEEVEISDVEEVSKTVIQPSEKNYAVAVCLSGIFGVLGIHHFYLGRYLEGVFDLSLAIITILLYMSGYPGLALVVFAIDSIHTFIVTIMLLVGSIKDGSGQLVCYPGQRLVTEK